MILNFICPRFYRGAFCDIIIIMKRTIWFWLYFIIAILLAIYFSVRIIMTTMGHTTVSRVHSISISADVRDKDLSALAAAAAIAPGTGAFSVDLNALNARVGAVPGVRASAVHRRADGNLVVRVKLYRAVALWTDGQNYFPLSADGTIVNQPDAERKSGTVLFRGPLPSDVGEITNAAHNLIGNLDYMEWIENRRWNLITTGGTTILLPEKNPDDAIAQLIVLDKNHKILSRDIKTIDMRDSARILVK